MSPAPIKEFHFVLMNGREGWVYAHEMKRYSTLWLFWYFGFYNEVIFFRDGKECACFQNFTIAEEAKEPA